MLFAYSRLSPPPLCFKRNTDNDSIGAYKYQLFIMLLILLAFSPFFLQECTSIFFLFFISSIIFMLIWHSRAIKIFSSLADGHTHTFWLL